MWIPSVRHTAVLANAFRSTGCFRAMSSTRAQQVVEALPQIPFFDHVPLPYDGPSKEEVYKLRQEFLNPAKFLHFKEPVLIVEGKMQYLFDEKGKRYLDAFAGIVTVSVGHCHPKVVQPIVDQLQRVQHTTTIYLNEQIALFGKELADVMPGKLKNVYFVNSGSEANDLAMTMARLYTGNYDILALRNAYHGASTSTMGLTAHSTWKYNTPQGFGVHHMINPDPYRGMFGADGKAYAADVKDHIRHATPGGPAKAIGSTDLLKLLLTSPFRLLHVGHTPLSIRPQLGMKATTNHLQGRSQPFSQSQFRAWGARSRSPKVTFRRSTRLCASTGASSLAMRSRRALGGPDPASGASRTTGSCRTSSPWQRASGTACRSRRSSPRPRLRPS
mmetsp:Transcript_8104/g.19398  ORF Transcript_8104/g.19398 Transcript_8104/m.19398 type:complete len:388 (+) Transcript_8104:243-1406(+)